MILRIDKLCIIQTYSCAKLLLQKWIQPATIFIDHIFGFYLQLMYICGRVSYTSKRQLRKYHQSHYNVQNLLSHLISHEHSLFHIIQDKISLCHIYRTKWYDLNHCPCKRNYQMPLKRFIYRTIYRIALDFSYIIT